MKRSKKTPDEKFRSYILTDGPIDISITWRGRVCSVNYRKTIAKGGPKKGEIVNSTYYNAFVHGVAWEAVAQTTYRNLKDIDVIIEPTLPPKYDHTNILKPVLDGLVLAGVLFDDYYINDVVILKARRHKKDEDSEILIHVKKTVA